MAGIGLDCGGMASKPAMLFSFHLFKSLCGANPTSMAFAISTELCRELQHFYLLFIAENDFLMT